MDNSNWLTLYNKAKLVQNNRVISPFIEAGAVSAAIESTTGHIYVGVCIDTASSLGMCAERNALAHMITCNESKVKRIVALMPNGKLGTPCGACREFLMQLDKDSCNIEILLSLEPIKTVTLGQLVPQWWGKSRFEKGM